MCISLLRQHCLPSTKRCKPAQCKKVVRTAVYPEVVLQYGSPGTFSWTVPANVTRISTDSYGGGGGGGGTDLTTTEVFGGGGGGSGAYITSNIPVKPGDLISIIVGIGGVGGVAPDNGTDGGDTIISGASFVLNAGGGGGGGSNTGAAGTGGIASTNTVFAFGINGQDGSNSVSLTPGLGGSAPTGGAGGYPGGTDVTPGLPLDPTPGIQPGGGGGASLNIGVIVNGGDGAPGYVRIRYTVSDSITSTVCDDDDDDECDDEDDCSDED